MTDESAALTRAKLKQKEEEAEFWYKKLKEDEAIFYTISFLSHVHYKEPVIEFITDGLGPDGDKMKITIEDTNQEVLTAEMGIDSDAWITILTVGTALRPEFILPKAGE